LIFAEAKARQLLLLRVSKGVSAHTIQLAQETLEMAEELGEAGKPVQLLALFGLIWMEADSGDVIDRTSAIEKGLSLAQELGDQFMVAEFMMFYINSRDRTKARMYSEKHLALRRELGDLDGIMMANLLTGYHHMENGAEADIPRARMLMEEAHQLAQIVRNPWGLWTAKCWLGILFCESGQIDIGIELFLQALPMSRHLDEAIWEIWVLNALGHAAVLQQDSASGLRYHQQAVDLSRNRYVMVSEMMSRINLAEVASMTGDLRLAETQYQAAVAAVSLNEYTGYLDGLAAFSLGRVAILKQEPTAASYFLEALEVFLQKGYSNGIAHCLDALAVLAAGQSSQAGLAAQLHGAVDRARVKFAGWFWGFALPLFLIPLDLSQLLAPARSALGEAEYNRLYEEGKAMSTQQILELLGEQIISL
jgi:tetratricopeptide (TPR) repeat protein